MTTTLKVAAAVAGTLLMIAGRRRRICQSRPGSARGPRQAHSKRDWLAPCGVWPFHAICVIARIRLRRTPSATAEGRKHYARYCATCHANDGSGDTSMGKGLFPRSPDMRKAPTQDLSDGELFLYHRARRAFYRYGGVGRWFADRRGPRVEARRVHSTVAKTDSRRSGRDERAEPLKRPAVAAAAQTNGQLIYQLRRSLLFV